MPHTEVVPMNKEIVKCKALKHRVQIRAMKAEEFIENHGSGTLRKNKRVGFHWRSQYHDERTAYEFGWGFRVIPASRLTYNDPITEGDNHSVTEAGWHIERYLNMSVFPEDEFECKYIIVEFGDGKREEGIGILVRRTSAAWIPGGHIVYAIVAKFDPVRKVFLPAENPF